MGSKGNCASDGESEDADMMRGMSEDSIYVVDSFIWVEKALLILFNNIAKPCLLQTSALEYTLGTLSR